MEHCSFLDLASLFSGLLALTYLVHVIQDVFSGVLTMISIQQQDCSIAFSVQVHVAQKYSLRLWDSSVIFKLHGSDIAIATSATITHLEVICIILHGHLDFICIYCKHPYYPGI